MTKTAQKKPVTANIIIAKRRELWESHHDINEDRRFTESVADRLTEKSAAGDALRLEVKDEPRLLIDMCFVIVDKMQQVVPFFLNDVQQALSNRIYQAEKDLKEGKIHSIKLNVLKGRQQGVTSYITSEQYARSAVRRNFSGFTIADSADNTHSIFEDKAKFIHENLPASLQPTEKLNNRRELIFDKINSKWRVAPASKRVGQSRTINFLHISEAAFLPVLLADVQAAVGQALTSDAVQVYESTPNGYNEFKDIWDSQSYINCYFEWWLTSEYQTPFYNDERKQMFINQVNSGTDWIWCRCKWLAEDKHLSWEQVYWYYNKHLELGELIKQEYSCSPDEAFLASGRCVFDQEKVIERKEHLKLLYKDNPPKQGEFRFQWNYADVKDFIKDDTITFTENKQGMVKIYEEPKPGYHYVIGGDTKGEGKDFFTATAINNITGVRVASVKCKLTNSKPFTWQIYCLGRYYNDALIGVEVNFNTAPIEELERLAYPSQYQRQQYDTFTGAYQKKFGFKTDGNTRPLIIDKEIDLIENNIGLFNDIDFLDECLTFIYDENGRPDAEVGKHDDLLFSDMIANEIRSQQSFEIDFTCVEEEYDEDEDDWKENAVSWYN